MPLLVVRYFCILYFLCTINELSQCKHSLFLRFFLPPIIQLLVCWKAASNLLPAQKLQVASCVLPSCSQLAPPRFPLTISLGEELAGGAPWARSPQEEYAEHRDSDEGDEYDQA
jgi:hypothetical protein